MKNGLLIRVDASSTIGLGHVMRCKALAHAWLQSPEYLPGPVTFVCRQAPEWVIEQLHADGMRTVELAASSGSAADAHELLMLGRKLQPLWYVVDGYQFDAAYQETVRNDGDRLLLLDDFGSGDRYAPTMLLNQNVNAVADLYAGRLPASSRLLLGPRYQLIDARIRRLRTEETSVADRVEHILVTVGGADPDQVTASVLALIERLDLPRVETRVLMGPAFPHSDMLIHAASALSGGCRLLPPAADMATHLAWADLAITAAGTTYWQLACLGVPAFVLALRAEHEALGSGLEKEGLALFIGPPARWEAPELLARMRHFLADRDMRLTMSRTMRRWVDGYGAERVAMLLAGARLRLQAVTFADARRLFDWANDAEVRAASFHQDVISWETHASWLKRQLAREDWLCFLAYDANDQPVGQIRFESIGGEEEWKVSVSVDKACRGRGLGTELIILALRRLWRQTPAKRAVAFIRTGNAASREAFSKAGFTPAGVKTVDGQEAIVMLREHRAA